MRSRYVVPLGVAILVVANVFVWWTIFSGDTRELTVTFLDVGQGDAILIESPTGLQMLIDGGGDRTVLRELGDVLGPYDRDIDIVVATHPDKDHIGGLADVFERYEVDYFLESGAVNDTSATAALRAAAQKEPDLTRAIATRGLRLDLGGGSYALVLYPDRDVSKVDTNDSSIAMRIVYGTTSFVFTGDVTSNVEEWLVLLDGDSGMLDADFLKAGHHGSKYATSDAWLASVTPSIVAISVGNNNSYGHPTQEVLERVASGGAKIYRTDEDGRLVFTSDGRTIYAP
jgi:competence protein ComEC